MNVQASIRNNMCYIRWYMLSVVLCVCFIIYFFTSITLITGSFHSTILTFCGCETEVQTLLRNNLFPATPKQPQLAFTFQLLDWLEAVMLECHVAVQDFVSAVNSFSANKLLRVC